MFSFEFLPSLAVATATLVLAATLSVGSAAAAPVCEVLAVSGPASLQLIEAERELRQGEWLEVGAELRTGPAGRVRLRFVDGSTLVLADRGRLRIERFEQVPGGPRLASMFLDLGLIGQQVAPSSAGRWYVRTPTAVTAVRGTEFMVEVGSDQSTTVHVQSGEVVVEAGGDYASKSVAAKGPPIRLRQPHHGTRCNALGQCSPAKVLAGARVKSLQERLAGI